MLDEVHATQSKPVLFLLVTLTVMTTYIPVTTAASPLDKFRNEKEEPSSSRQWIKDG
jgi:hypothetical protein